MGLAMEGRGHTLRDVGNFVISIHHEAHFMEGAATMLYTPPCRRQPIQECGQDHGCPCTLSMVCTLAIYAPVSRTLRSTGGRNDHGGGCFVLPMVCIL